MFVDAFATSALVAYFTEGTLTTDVEHLFKVFSINPT